MPTTPRRGFRVPAPLAGAVTFFLVAVATARYGAGFTADSAWYVATARGLVRGDGFTAHAEQPFVNWPPLFPLVISLGTASGVDALVVARWLNAVVLALVVTLACAHVNRRLDDPVVRLTAVASIALAVPLVGAGVMVWSEPLFLLLALLALGRIEARSDDLRGAVIAGVLVGLAVMTRYLGVVLVLAGVVALVRTPAPLRGRLGRAGAFSVVALVPLALWLVRNARLTGTPVGERAGPHVLLGDQLWALVDHLSRWWLPARIPATSRIAVTAALLVLLVAGALVIAPRMPRPRRVSAAGLFVIFYLVALVSIVATTAVDRIDDRLLAPIYVTVMAGGWMLVDRVVVRLGASRRRARNVARVAVACWALYPILHVTVDVAHRSTVGAGGYNRDRWQRADVVEWIRAHPLPSPVASNDPDALYLLTGVAARPRISSSTSHGRHEDVPPVRTVVVFGGVGSPPRAAVDGTALFSGRDGTVVATTR